MLAHDFGDGRKAAAGRPRNARRASRLANVGLVEAVQARQRLMLGLVIVAAADGEHDLEARALVLQNPLLVALEERQLELLPKVRL